MSYEAPYDGYNMAVIIINALRCKTQGERLLVLCNHKAHKSGTLRWETQNGRITAQLDHMIKLCVAACNAQSRDDRLERYCKSILESISRTDIIRAILNS